MSITRTDSRAIYASLELAPPHSTLQSAAPLGPQPGAGGFRAGTRVVMAHGETRPVEDLRSGECVLSAGGRVNRVVATFRRPAGDEPLFGLNTSPPFVTGQACFATPAGLKAFDALPADTDLPPPQATRLGLEDRLATQSGVPLRLYDYSVGFAEPGEMLHGLVVDGDGLFLVRYAGDHLLVRG